MCENDTQTVLIVKSTGEEAKYAQLLFQLISKFSNIESGQPMTENEYKISSSTVDKNNKEDIPKGKIIFLGNGKEAEIQGKSINWQYESFGMKYGWLGNRCVITVDKNEIFNTEKSKNAFVDYFNSRIESYKNIMDFNKLQEYSESIDDIVLPKKSDDGIDKFAKGFTLALLAPLYAIGKGLEGIVNLSDKDELWKRQYELLICEFLLNGFVKFMNNLKEKEIIDQMIIVYDIKDAEYAHLLHNLIHQYSSYDVAELPEKLFIENAKKYSSKNKIIFIGETKSAKERSFYSKKIFEEHGMCYGWIGNHAFINIETLKSNQRESFLNYYSQKAESYENKAKTYAKREDSSIGKDFASALNIFSVPFAALAPITLPALVLSAGIRYAGGAAADKIIDAANAIADLSWYQYHLLLREFVFNGLSKFMDA